MILALTFIPSIIIGIIIGIRAGSGEGFAAFLSSAILNGIVAYGLTH